MKILGYSCSVCVVCFFVIDVVDDMRIFVCCLLKDEILIIFGVSLDDKNVIDMFVLKLWNL